MHSKQKIIIEIPKVPEYQMALHSANISNGQSIRMMYLCVLDIWICELRAEVNNFYGFLNELTHLTDLNDSTHNDSNLKQLFVIVSLLISSKIPEVSEGVFNYFISQLKFLLNKNN